MAIRYISTALTGSHAWTDTAIWVGGVVPSTGDDVVLLSAPRGFLIDSGLAQSAVVLASLTQYNSFAGSIGGTGNNPLAIGVTVGLLGVPPEDGSQGNGSPSVKIDTGTNAVNWTVYSSAGTGTESPLPTVCLRGVNAGNILNVLGGVVGLGTLVPGEASTFAAVNCRGGRVEVGSGVTYTTATNDGGVMVLNAGASATISNLTGTLRTAGDYTVTALTNADVMQIGHRVGMGAAITTFTMNGGTCDFSVNPAPITIGTSNLNAGAITQFTPAQVTWGTMNLAASVVGFSIQPQ